MAKKPPRAARSKPSPLDELIEISRAIGADPDLVQGGGGNTSVKSQDGKRIWVKASGTSLAEMDRRRGWAELDLVAARELLRVDGLADLPEDERESEVLRLLSETVRRPEGARPSVESSLHAILDRVVIHTHPVGLNALLCARGSRRLFETFLDGQVPGGLPVLYVPYVDPGFTLGARLDEEIARYRDRHGEIPPVVLLENHGLFVSAPTVRACLRLSNRITTFAMQAIGGRRINSRRFPVVGKSTPPDGGAAIRGVLLRAGCAPCVVRRDDSAIAAELLGDPKALAATKRGAFSPDQIVYCRTFPCVMPRGASPEQRVAAIVAYREQYGLDPRVIVVPDGGVYYCASGLEKLRVVSEVYRAAITVILRSVPFGGPRFLSRRQASFIEGWEVEHFRAAVGAIEAASLDGRVVAVAGAGTKYGRETVRALLDVGAVVAAIDDDLDRLSSAPPERLLALEVDWDREPTVRRAFRSLEASVGGLDGLVLACGSGAPPPLAGGSAGTLRRVFDCDWTPAFLCLREAMDAFARQDAGGSIVDLTIGSPTSFALTWLDEVTGAGVSLMTVVASPGCGEVVAASLLSDDETE